MRRIFFVLSLLVAAAILAQAQSSTSPSGARSAQATQLQLGPGPITLRGACPVGMTARQQGGGQTLWTISLEDSAKPHSGALPKPGTGVHVDLRAWKGGPIRQVELAVDYLAPGWRVVPVKTVKPGDNLKKTYNLAASDGESLQLAGDLLVGQTAGITRVTVLGIDYADGTHWHADDRDACSVAPNGFMLVGAK